MNQFRPCPAHTPNRRDVAFSAAQALEADAPMKTVVVEFVEETRHRVRLQVPAECDLDDIEADLPNMLASNFDDGFIDLVRHIERVDILDSAPAHPLDAA